MLAFPPSNVVYSAKTHSVTITVRVGALGLRRVALDAVAADKEKYVLCTTSFSFSSRSIPDGQTHGRLVGRSCAPRGRRDGADSCRRRGADQCSSMGHGLCRSWLHRLWRVHAPRLLRGRSPRYPAWDVHYDRRTGHVSRGGHGQRGHWLPRRRVGGHGRRGLCYHGLSHRDLDARLTAGVRIPRGRPGRADATSDSRSCHADATSDSCSCHTGSSSNGCFHPNIVARHAIDGSPLYHLDSGGESRDRDARPPNGLCPHAETSLDASSDSRSCIHADILRSESVCNMDAFRAGLSLPQRRRYGDAVSGSDLAAPHTDAIFDSQPHDTGDVISRLVVQNNSLGEENTRHTLFLLSYDLRKVRAPRSQDRVSVSVS